MEKMTIFFLEILLENTNFLSLFIFFFDIWKKEERINCQEKYKGEIKLITRFGGTIIRRKGRLRIRK